MKICPTQQPAIFQDGGSFSYMVSQYTSCIAARIIVSQVVPPVASDSCNNTLP